MYSYLLYPDKNLAGEVPYPSFQDIFKDLNLNILLKTMAKDDIFMLEQIRQIMMYPIREKAHLMYRYDIVKDFKEHPQWAEDMYQIAVSAAKLAESFKKEMEQSRGKTAAKTSIIIATFHFISDSLNLSKNLIGILNTRGISLKSQGLLQLKERMESYPWDELQQLHHHLQFFTTGGEGIFSIGISGGLKMTEACLKDCKNYNTTNISGTQKTLRKLYYKVLKRDTLIVEDEELEKDINFFIQENIQQVVNQYEPWVRKMQDFLLNFSREIAFYKGIFNLQTRMEELQLPLCYATVCCEGGKKELEGLYELAMALYTQTYPIPNSMKQTEKVLTVITGANQGGKSTFLRSFGIAQVMMQCGMPVPADSYTSTLYSRIHTHFTRKEDAMLSRGRLEEEMKRMDGIVSSLDKGSLLLLNESFASTTEKEGSQIAYNIIMPLYEKGIEIMMVTHLHEFARNLYEKQLSHADFLVAERLENGQRTFHILPGAPHYSSYGTDLYQMMIGTI